MNEITFDIVYKALFWDQQHWKSAGVCTLIEDVCERERAPQHIMCTYARRFCTTKFEMNFLIVRKKSPKKCSFLAQTSQSTNNRQWPDARYGVWLQLKHITAIQRSIGSSAQMNEMMIMKKTMETKTKTAKKLNFIWSPRNTNLNKASPIWRLSVCASMWRSPSRFASICCGGGVGDDAVVRMVESTMPGNSMKNTHSLVSNTNRNLFVCVCV